ncbi:MAG: transcriptional regulator, MarR family [Deltaproteobacteria bacterium]|nr:transcriptional regulator, MarR family [Deltaproteobacteria bacterium]
MKNDDRLIYLVFMAQQKLKTHITNVLLTDGIKVTLGQAGILFLLQHHDGQTMTGLSKALAVENPTLTGLIDRLERSGFVRRQAGSEDRRSFGIFLTPEGIKECEKVKPVIKKINNEMKVGFTREEIEVFKSVLQSLFKKFDKPEKGRVVSTRRKPSPRLLVKAAASEKMERR